MSRATAGTTARSSSNSPVAEVGVDADQLRSHQCRADDARGVAEPGQCQLRLRAVVLAGDQSGQNGAGAVQEQVGGTGHSATDHDHGRVQHVPGDRQANAEPASQVRHRLEGHRVPGPRRLGDHRSGERVRIALGQVGENGRSARLPQFASCLGQRGAGAVPLPAPPLAARTGTAVRDDDDVSEFRRDTERPSIDPPVQHQSGTDAGADGHQQRDRRAGRRATAIFSPRSGVHIVFHDHRQTQAVREALWHRVIPPGQVGRKHHRGPVRRDEPSDCEAHSRHLVLSTQSVHQLCEHVFGSAHRPRGGRPGRDDYRAVRSDHAGAHRCPTDIDADSRRTIGGGQLQFDCCHRTMIRSSPPAARPAGAGGAALATVASEVDDSSEAGGGSPATVVGSGSRARSDCTTTSAPSTSLAVVSGRSPRSTASSRHKGQAVQVTAADGSCPHCGHPAGAPVVAGSSTWSPSEPWLLRDRA